MVCYGNAGGVGGGPNETIINGVKIYGSIREVKELTLPSKNGSLFVASTQVTLGNGVKVTLDPAKTAENKAAKASIWVNSTGNQTSTNTSFFNLNGFGVLDTEKQDKMSFRSCQTDGGTIDTTSSGYKKDMDEITVLDSNFHGTTRKSNVEVKANRGDTINESQVMRSGTFSNEDIPELPNRTYSK